MSIHDESDTDLCKAWVLNRWHHADRWCCILQCMIWVSLSLLGLWCYMSRTRQIVVHIGCVHWVASWYNRITFESKEARLSVLLVFIYILSATPRFCSPLRTASPWGDPLYTTKFFIKEFSYWTPSSNMVTFCTVHTQTSNWDWTIIGSLHALMVSMAIKWYAIIKQTIQ